MQSPGRSAPFRWTRKRIALIVLGAVLFLAISAGLARFLTTDNLEREKDVALIKAEAKGDAASMIRQLHGCAADAACVATQRENAANPRLLRAGEVKILSLNSSTANSPAGATGRTRVAWTVIGKLPVVQCIDVRRTGNALTGVHVTLLALSKPIGNEADC
jgi:N-acetylglutamate synthase/N-acetylornithine aminotransferase